MKQCNWCGKEYPDDSDVCLVDGHPLESPNSKYMVKRPDETEEYSFTASAEEIRAGYESGKFPPDWAVRKETDGVFDWITVQDLCAAELNSIVLPPAEDKPQEQTSVAQTSPQKPQSDPEIEKIRNQMDWFIVVPTGTGERHVWDKKQFVKALRTEILAGQLKSETPIETHVKSKDGKWNQSSLPLADFTKGHFKLRVLYEPVWSYAIAGLKWGALTGVALKFLDTFILFISVNPRLAFLFLATIAVCAIPRIGIVAVIMISIFMSQFTKVNLFMAVFTAGLTGASLGCLPGMAIGGAIGLSCKKGLPLAKDAKPEGQGLALKTIGLPLLGGAGLWGFYIYIFNPWLVSLMQ